MLGRERDRLPVGNHCAPQMTDSHHLLDGSSIGGTVESYRDENVRANIIRVRHDVDELVLYPQAGHLLSNITT